MSPLALDLHIEGRFVNGVAFEFVVRRAIEERVIIPIDPRPATKAPIGTIGSPATGITKARPDARDAADAIASLVDCIVEADDQVGITGRDCARIAISSKMLRDSVGILRELQAAIETRVVGNDRKGLTLRYRELLEARDLRRKRSGASCDGQQRNGNNGFKQTEHSDLGD